MKLVFLFLLLFLPANADARDELLANCRLTPSIKNEDTYPGKESMGRTNNLRRSTGAVAKAYGRFMIISGRVMDENCVPVPDVVVELWQMNHKGKYQHLITKEEAEFDPNFIGSGTIITDNLGRFYFLTVKPGREKGRSPHFNVTVTSKNFEKFETDIYFNDERILNYYDKELSNIPKDRVNLVKAAPAKDFSEVINGELTYVIDITIKGRDKFRGF